MVGINSHIGKQIQKARSRLGISQANLAARLGMSAKMLAKYESGQASIGAAQLLSIALQLDVPVMEFYEKHTKLPKPSTTRKQQKNAVILPFPSENNEVSRLLDYYWKIEDPVTRDKIRELAAKLARGTPPFEKE